MSKQNEDKCPVMHGSLTSNSASGTSNQDWWPNQLNLNILHQHDQKSDPLAEDFDYIHLNSEYVPKLKFRKKSINKISLENLSKK